MLCAVSIAFPHFPPFGSLGIPALDRLQGGMWNLSEPEGKNLKVFSIDAEDRAETGRPLEAAKGP